MYGTTGLRIVDASVLPRVLRNTGPASSVYMLAEFMAEVIINSTKAEHELLARSTSADVLHANNTVIETACGHCVLPKL